MGFPLSVGCSVTFKLWNCKTNTTFMMAVKLKACFIFTDSSISCCKIFVFFHAFFCRVTFAQGHWHSLIPCQSPWPLALFSFFLLAADSLDGLFWLALLHSTHHPSHRKKKKKKDEMRWNIAGLHSFHNVTWTSCSLQYKHGGHARDWLAPWVYRTTI